MRGLTAGLLGLALLAPTAGAAEFTPAGEAANYSKINERYAHESGTPEYRALMQERGIESEAELTQIQVEDPERDNSGNICRHHYNECAGDIRLWAKHWAAAGYGIAEPVLFTGRSGAVLAGHVWATKAGPPLRPAVVLTTGSVQAPEVLYLWAATTLAKEGYVVLTYDVQGQGRSDTYGEGADHNEGFPSQAGQPFYDGTEDALDFLLSTPTKPYHPRKSCTTGTSHDAKQQRRVAADLNSSHNPLSQFVDPGRVGLLGHSLGASGVSYVGQLDPRVKAIVAFDNLRDSSASGGASACPSGSSPRPATVPLTKPALGMSNDYGLTPTPFTAAPDERSKNSASAAYTKAGLPTGQLNIRGGTHYEYSYIPNPDFGATLRGMDMVSWYTTAWLNRYLKGGEDEAAERMLRTSRWRTDARGAEVDTGGDGNLFSHYLKSRLAIGGFACEDLRAGCPGQSADDGRPPNYSYYALATTKDSDTVAPPAAGTFDVRASVQVPKTAVTAGTDGSVPVRVVASGDTGDLDHFELQVSRYSGRRTGAYRTIAGRLGNEPHVFRGRFGTTYRFRARAVSRGRRAGPWAYATTMVPFDAAPGRMKFRGSWAAVEDGAAWNGSFRRAGRTGASMIFRWRGSILHLVGRRSPSGGRAWLYVDGRRRAVSFRSRKVRNRTLIFAEKVSGGGIHTARLVSRGGSVAVDAVGVAP